MAVELLGLLARSAVRGMPALARIDLPSCVSAVWGGASRARRRRRRGHDDDDDVLHSASSDDAERALSSDSWSGPGRITRGFGSRERCNPPETHE
ncbi:hypothetical protein Aduo_009697 [Ancylostoma duodenale]